MRWAAYLICHPLTLLLFRLRIEGKEHLPKTGPVILAANHASYLDPILVGLAAWPRWAYFMAKASLFRFPLFGSLIRRFGAFPVNRDTVDRSAIDTALRLLADGEIVGIYPQGTRLKSVAAEQAARGVGLLASRSRAPVVPVAIIGSDRVWRGGIIPIRFPRITVKVGEPLHLQGKGRAAQEDFSKRVLEEIVKLTSSKFSSGSVA